MNYNKNEAGILLPVTVIEDITVNVLPNKQHEFLLSTTDVAIGYATTKYAIFKALDRHNDEFIEGKHFIRGVDILSIPAIQPNAILWAKAGIIRLGFFIRSERAKLFRDWAENLILATLAPDFIKPKQLPVKRKHNRLTADRLVRLLTLSSRIADSELRTAIVNELTGGL